MIYIDRSRIEAGWMCPRREWWGYHYDGTGVTPITLASELTYGTAIHEGGRAINMGEGLDAAIKVALAQLPSTVTPDVRALAIGQVVCYADLMRRFVNGHEVVAVEQEMAWEIAPGLMFMCKPDLILRRRDGLCIYLETKTTSNNSTSWLESWDTAVQVHTGMWVAQQLHPEWTMDHTRIVGLYKGYQRQGVVQSPLVWAYRSRGNGGVLPTQWKAEYVRGWDKVGTWEYPGGTRAYVEDVILPDDGKRSEQVFMTRPITLNHALTEAFLRQTIQRRRVMAEALAISTTVPDEVVFPQFFSQCKVRWGKCPYYECCWSPEVGEDPVGSGQYVVRTPHHSTEAEDA